MRRSPQFFGLTTLCFVVVKLSLNCGKRNLKHLGILSLDGNRFCYWKFRMTVVRFLTLTGGSGLSLRVGCVGNLKTLDCIIFSVGFLRISVRVFEDFTIEDIYGLSLLLPPGNSFDTELAR